MSKRQIPRQQELLSYALATRRAEPKGRPPSGKYIPTPEMDAVDFKEMSQEQRDFLRDAMEKFALLPGKRDP